MKRAKQEATTLSSSSSSALPLVSSSPSSFASSSSPSSSVTGNGRGLSLGDVTVFTKRMEKVANEDSRTKLLYHVCFPLHYGEIPERLAKKTLRSFSGYATPELRHKAEERLKEYQDDLDLLRRTNRLLDLPSEGDAQSMMTALINWLSSPQMIVHPPKEESTSASHQTGSSTTTEKKPSASRRRPKDRLKRPPNPYLLFATDRRDEVTSSNPGVPMMEVNRLLGQLWASANDETRTKYIKLSEIARAKWEKDNPDLASQVGRGGSRKRKRADEESGAGGHAGSDHDSEMSDPPRQPSATPVAPWSGSSHPHSASPAPTAAADHELALQLGKSISAILALADINMFSMRNMKTALARSFGEKVVVNNQHLIAQLVDRELMAMH